MSRFYYCPRCKKQFQKEELHLMCSDCGFQFSTYKIDKAVHKQTVMKKIKPLIIVGIIILVFGSVFIFIRNRCQIGKICDDGGIIYFDKMFYSNGWRYLEVAPKSLAATQWSETINEKATSELTSGIGKGAYNSYNIIYRYGAKSAAYKAINYGKSDDWYLGSRKEMKILKIIYKCNFFKSKFENLENFDSFGNKDSNSKTRHIYWTSELSDKNSAYAINFENGEENILKCSESCFVRPIRKF